MRWSEVDDVTKPTLWTTPPERVKQSKRAERSKQRVYLTPLPPLAQRILKGVPRPEDDTSGFVFPGRVEETALSPTGSFTKRLVAAGAPDDFGYHALRHTLATWLAGVHYCG